MIWREFRFYKPCSSLLPYVRYYWMLDSVNPFCIYTFPIGCTQIIFHKKTPLYVPELKTWQYKLTVSGQTNFSSHLSAPDNIRMIVIVFRPHAMSAFLGVSSRLFYNKELDGSDLGNKELNELAARLYYSDSDDAYIKHIEEWLLKQLSDNVFDVPGKRAGTTELNMRRAEFALNLIYANPNVSIAELSSKCCLSRKQFERIFSLIVGINPKEYARIVRFQKVLAIMQQHLNPEIRLNNRAITLNNGKTGDVCLAGLAYWAGYSDQSHMIREFRALSRYTPADILKKAIPYSDLFTEPV